MTRTAESTPRPLIGPPDGARVRGDPRGHNRSKWVPLNLCAVGRGPALKGRSRGGRDPYWAARARVVYHSLTQAAGAV